LRGLAVQDARRCDWTAPRHAGQLAGAHKNLAMIWRDGARLRAAAARRGETRRFPGVAGALCARVATRDAGNIRGCSRIPQKTATFFAPACKGFGE
jgi:hypothetical protein